MSRTPDPRFDALTAHGADDERRVDAGDGLDVFGPHCAFRCTFCYSHEHGCAYEVRGHRLHDGMQVPACQLHMDRAGFLNDDARAAYVKVLAYRLARPKAINVPRPLRTALAIRQALNSAGIEARTAGALSTLRVEFGTPRAERFPFRLTLDESGGVVLDIDGGCAGACDGELFELVEMCTEVAQHFENECLCEFGDTTPNPLCRQHGHEDVTSGAYDRNPQVRAAIDRELARVNR